MWRCNSHLLTLILFRFRLLSPSSPSNGNHHIHHSGVCVPDGGDGASAAKQVFNRRGADRICRQSIWGVETWRRRNRVLHQRTVVAVFHNVRKSLLQGVEMRYRKGRGEGRGGL